MNYELAVMALEGLSRSPLTIEARDAVVEFRGSPASFRELARLCLLLGGEDVEPDEELELTPGLHLTDESPRVRIRLA